MAHDRKPAGVNLRQRGQCVESGADVLTKLGGLFAPGSGVGNRVLQVTDLKAVAIGVARQRSVAERGWPQGTPLGLAPSPNASGIARTPGRL